MRELRGKARERAGLPAAGGTARDELPVHAVRAAARHDRGRRQLRRDQPVRDAPEPCTAAGRPGAGELFRGPERGGQGFRDAGPRGLGRDDADQRYWYRPPAGRDRDRQQRGDRGARAGRGERGRDALHLRRAARGPRRGRLHLYPERQARAAARLPGRPPDGGGPDRQRAPALRSSRRGRRQRVPDPGPQRGRGRRGLEA